MKARSRPTALWRLTSQAALAGTGLLLKMTGCGAEGANGNASGTGGEATSSSGGSSVVEGSGAGGSIDGAAGGLGGAGADADVEMGVGGSSEGPAQGGDGGMGGTGSDDAPAEIMPCKERRLQYFSGHGDLYVAHLNGELSLMLRGSFDPDLPHESLYDPTDVCIRLPEVAPFTLPEGSGFAPTGVEPGVPFWLIPQVSDPGRVWLGTATYELSVAEFGAHSALELLWDSSRAPQAGAVSLFVNSTFGSPSYWMATTDEHLAFTEHINGSHTHSNWTFNQPGEYDLVFRVSAERVEGGGTLLSEPTAFHFFIGDE